MGKMMTVAELAEYLQLHPQTIYKKVERGELPCYRSKSIGRGAIRFDLDVINALIHGQSVVAKTESVQEVVEKPVE